MTSAASLAEAERRAGQAGLANVTFLERDIFDLPFEPGSFGHAFVCFVLEHLARPVEALTAVATLLGPGGTITVIEGDHGSAYFHPDNPAARAAIRCQIELQARAGGDALIGRKVYPLMVAAGFEAEGSGLSCWRAWLRIDAAAVVKLAGLPPGTGASPGSSCLRDSFASPADPPTWKPPATTGEPQS